VPRRQRSRRRSYDALVAVVAANPHGQRLFVGSVRTRGVLVVRGVSRRPLQQISVQRVVPGRSLSGKPELGRDGATGWPRQLLAVARTCDCLANTAPPAMLGGGRPARA
jgi:hypothetical protein